MIVAPTERLSLRRVTLDDAPFFLDLLNSEGFLYGIGDRGVRTLDDARAYIEAKFFDAYTRHGFGGYVVERRADGVPVGQCGLVSREAFGWVELGYALLPAFCGNGYAVEAGRATLEHARELGIETVHAIVLPENQPSVRVLERLGFARAGTVRVPGDPVELDHWQVRAGASAG